MNNLPSSSGSPDQLALTDLLTSLAGRLQISQCDGALLMAQLAMSVGRKELAQEAVDLAGKFSPQDPRIVIFQRQLAPNSERLRQRVPFLYRLQADAFAHLSVDGYQPDLQGWVNEGFDRVLTKVVENLRRTPTPIVIEVGSWKGASANRIAQTCRQAGVDLLALICIDTWLGAPEFYTWGLDEPTRGVSLKRQLGYPTVFQTFTKNAKALGTDDLIVPFPMSSTQAAEVLAYYQINAAAIYVDGSHEYSAVLNDLNSYYPLLSGGGVFWGDDYDQVNWPGVVAAVQEFAAKHGLAVELEGVNWLLQKPLVRESSGLQR